MPEANLHHAPDHADAHAIQYGRLGIAAQQLRDIHVAIMMGLICCQYSAFSCLDWQLKHVKLIQWMLM